MYFSLTFFNFSRMLAVSSFSVFSFFMSCLFSFLPIYSSSISTSKLCSFSLTKSIRCVTSSLGSSYDSANLLAFFQIFVSISVEDSCSTSNLLCCSNFYFKSFSLGILLRLVCSHFSISRPPGGCWLDISCKDKVTTFSDVSCNLSKTRVLTLLTEYSRLPSATPTICAIMYELLLVETFESIRYRTKHPFTSSSKRLEFKRSTMKLRVRVRGRMWSPKLLMDGMPSKLT